MKIIIRRHHIGYFTCKKRVFCALFAHFIIQENRIQSLTQTTP